MEKQQKNDDMEAILLPYPDAYALRLIATANETTVEHMIRYMMLCFLDGRKDSLKDGNFRN